ncbi:MAG TPA: protein kinase [Pirellulales bacterium]|nr:protein kinase [Pirellulales bacterium]
MAPQTSVTHFLDTVEKSGLVDRARLDEVLTALEHETGSAALHDTQVVSSHLTGRGLLTGWQSEQLLEGRYRGFFLGKYKLLDHLGSGGMSSVYLAEHQVMRRRVAIKVLPTNQAEDHSRVRRFHREARAVASLDHPHIVRAFDVDQEGDVHYLVMEYVQGRDLKTLVEKEGPLPAAKAADYIRQAADGLASAHGLGLVHRDMKPANLIVDGRGVLKVLDLGLASVKNDIDSAITSEFDDKVLGTVDYLAPEQALDSHIVDGRADIYSLGCTLYFALVGHPPFGDGSLGQRLMSHQVREPADIRLERPDVPESLVSICRRMMAKSPAARYQTMEAVSSALSEWLHAPAPEAKPATGDEELTLAPLDDVPTPSTETRRSGVAKPSLPKGRIASPSVQSRQNKPPRASAPPRVESPPVDWLLADLPPIATLDAATSGSTKIRNTHGEHSLAPRGRAGGNRWESPWLLIGVGTGLGLLLIAIYFALRTFLG